MGDHKITLVKGEYVKGGPSFNVTSQEAMDMDFVQGRPGTKEYAVKFRYEGKERQSDRLAVMREELLGGGLSDGDDGLSEENYAIIRKRLKSGQYKMAGDDDAVSGLGKKVYVIHDLKGNRVIKVPKNNKTKWLEKFEEESTVVLGEASKKVAALKAKYIN